MSIAPLTIEISGNSTVPIGSACTSGFSETRPSSRAVGSPSRSAVHACAISCTVNENRRTIKLMKMPAKSKFCKGYRLRPTREKGKDRIGGFGADDGRQLLARGAAHTGDAAKGPQQRVAPARADAGHLVELGAQIAHRARAAMKRDGEAMRFVADALDQEERRIVRGERDRILVLARVDQLFLFRDADGHQVRQAELFERGVAGRELPLAAVDEHEIGKRSAELEQLPVAPQHDLVHRGEVVLLRAADSEFPVVRA